MYEKEEEEKKKKRKEKKDLHFIQIKKRPT